MLSSEPQWVALYTNPRAEKQVEKNLLREGYEVYLPLVRELHTWSDRKKWVEVPLIKSYIFAKITARQEALIRGVVGVSFLIKFKDNVLTIPEKEIQMMKNFIASKVEIQVRTVEELHRGRRVRIHSGSLAGMEGTLVSDCEEGNFAVEISGISFALVTYVDKDLMEAIADDEESKTASKQKKYNIR
ncbi:MAG: UpxY family transcription antiterminator [Bacteroidales bacterium]|nr:UpxY family transcription antiterminator [Bacteroidales bacterium]